MNSEYEKSVQNLKESLDDWAETTIHDTEEKLAKNLLGGILDTSKLVDQFSTWLLAGAGATSVLLISNLESISGLVGSINYQFTLGFVCMSLVFGVLAKIAALRITIHRVGEKAGHEIATAVLEEHEKVENEIDEIAEPHNIQVKTEIDIEHVLSIIINAYPKIFHKRFKESFIKIMNDPMYEQKKAIKIYIWQSAFTILEVISFLLFVVSVIVGA